MSKVLRYTTWVVLAAILAFSFGGCNTFRGMGQDIRAAGRAIQHAGSK